MARVVGIISSGTPPEERVVPEFDHCHLFSPNPQYCFIAQCLGTARPQWPFWKLRGWTSHDMQPKALSRYAASVDREMN